MRYRSESRISRGGAATVRRAHSRGHSCCWCRGRRRVRLQCLHQHEGDEMRAQKRGQKWDNAPAAQDSSDSVTHSGRDARCEPQLCALRAAAAMAGGTFYGATGFDPVLILAQIGTMQVGSAARLRFCTVACRGVLRAQRGMPWGVCAANATPRPSGKAEGGAVVPAEAQQHASAPACSRKLTRCLLRWLHRSRALLSPPLPCALRVRRCTTCPWARFFSCWWRPTAP